MHISNCLRVFSLIQLVAVLNVLVLPTVNMYLFYFFSRGLFFLSSIILSVLFSFCFLILVDDDASTSEAVLLSTEVLLLDSCPTGTLPPFTASLSSKIAGTRSWFPLKLLTPDSFSSAESISLVFPFASTGG